MYPFLKFIYVSINASLKTKLKPFDTVKTNLWVGLSDVDFYLELNNGRQLVMCDLGRTELGIRTGIHKMASRKKWAFMIASTQAKYRHRLPLFSRYTLETKMISYDERWFYFHQKTIRKGKIHSEFILRSAVINTKGLVPSREVIQEMGLPWAPMESKYVQEIQESEWLK